MVVELYRTDSHRFVGRIRVRDGYLFLEIDRGSDLEAVLEVLGSPALQGPGPENPWARWSDEVEPSHEPMKDDWFAYAAANGLADAGYRPVLRTVSPRI